MTAYTDVIINPGRMIVNTFIHLLSEKIKDKLLLNKVKINTIGMEAIKHSAIPEVAVEC